MRGDAAAEFLRLIRIMSRLRGRRGCPWDREQTHETLLKCLIEEAYEFHEAALSKNDEKMCEELGDLMLQIVFHARLATERKAFGMAEVCRSISDKLIRRHPHVFGKTKVRDSNEVLSNWEKIKRSEPGNRRLLSVLDGVPGAFPALLKALKLQKRAARAGFDWRRAKPVLDKILEETGEIRAEMKKRGRPGGESLALEIGDLLFSVVNLARHLKVDPEVALSLSNRKFERRFRRMERKIASRGGVMKRMSLSALDRYWEAEKLKS
jgi:tetrapyrrole methylase family protein/MazG family protein